MKMTIFASLILATLAFAGCQSAATQVETKTEIKTETKMETTQKQKEIAQVSVTEAKKAIEDKKDAQFIDVRTIEEYAGGHAVGAKNLPLDKLEADFAELDKNKPVSSSAKPDAVRRKARKFCRKPDSRIFTTSRAERPNGKARDFRRKNNFSIGEN